MGKWRVSLCTALRNTQLHLTSFPYKMRGLMQSAKEDSPSITFNVLRVKNWSRHSIWLFLNNDFNVKYAIWYCYMLMDGGHDIGKNYIIFTCLFFKKKKHVRDISLYKTRTSTNPELIKRITLSLLFYTGSHSNRINISMFVCGSN